jgi:hypothetical protein
MIVSGYFHASAVHIDIAPASIVQDLYNHNLVHRGQFFQMHMLEIALVRRPLRGLSAYDCTESCSRMRLGIPDLARPLLCLSSSHL